MKSAVHTVEVTSYVSEVMPEISTQNPDLAEVITWADAHPVTYSIVTATKSKAFGLGSSDYIGWAQKDKTPEGVLERLSHLRRAALTDEDSFWHWRAHFTMEHYAEKKFTGGFFEQHAIWDDDKEYSRSCLMLDYTPDTLEEVLDRFVAWMDPWYSHSGKRRTMRITVNGEDKRIFHVAAEQSVSSSDAASNGNEESG